MILSFWFYWLTAKDKIRGEALWLWAFAAAELAGELGAITYHFNHSLSP